jgi:universal stress protein A
MSTETLIPPPLGSSTQNATQQNPALKSAAPQSLQLKRILAPTDFSPQAQKAVRYALRFAQQFKARLELLYVADTVRYVGDYMTVTQVNDIEDSLLKEGREKLTAVQGQLSSAGDAPVEIESFVRSGVPHHEITEVARQRGADLIVISTHGRTGLLHALLGSTAERVVRHATCPVLVVRDRERDFVPAE